MQFLTFERRKMSESIIVALITSAVTVFGVILSNSKSTAVTNTEIKHLTEEVKKHNNFAVRVPVLEEQIKALTEKIEAVGRSAQAVGERRTND